MKADSKCKDLENTDKKILYYKRQFMQTVPNRGTSELSVTEIYNQ